MLGASDDDQIRYAAQRRLLIVSYNQRHFRIWHACFEREGVLHGGMLLGKRSGLPGGVNWVVGVL